MPALANALNWAVILGYYKRNPVEVERLATELIELSTHHHFAYWRAIGIIFRGWARSISGDVAGGIASIEDGIEYRRVNGIRGGGGLALQAEALHLADRTSEALRAIREAEALVERREEWWSAELHRLEGVFLTAMGADDTQIEASFLRSHQDCKGTEVGFARETRRSNLRGIPPPKSVRRARVPIASLLGEAEDS